MSRTIMHRGFEWFLNLAETKTNAPRLGRRFQFRISWIRCVGSCCGNLVGIDADYELCGWLGGGGGGGGEDRSNV